MRRPAALRKGLLPAFNPRELHLMRELPFVQVRAMSRQVLVGPYGVLLAAFAHLTVGFVQLRRRDEAQSS